MLGSSRVAAQLVASKGGLSSMKLVLLVYDGVLVDYFGLNRPIVFNDRHRFLISVIINLSTLSLHYVKYQIRLFCLVKRMFTADSVFSLF
jgi:hypothetical protein